MAVFAWPLAVTAISVIAMLLFRKPISRFLDRANKIGTTGIEATTGEQDTAKSEAGPSAADELTHLFHKQFLAEREASILTELEHIVGAKPTQKEKSLIQIIAAQVIIHQFEATYRDIYGSQLTALDITNTTPSGVPLGVFETLYNQAAAQHKDRYANYSFEQWLEWLSQLLIIRDDKIYITLAGKEFLKYLTHRGYTLFKYG